MVNAVNDKSQSRNYEDSINYNDAKNFIRNENGVTKEVFIRYTQAQFPGMSKQEAEAIFNQIDRNGSGGLREREFNWWSADDNVSNSGNNGGDKPNNTGSAGGGNSRGSITVLPGVEFLDTVDLKRDSDYGDDDKDNVDDKISTRGANYIFLDESHGEDHTQLKSNEAPKISGFTLVQADSYGAGDKSGFLYVRDQGNNSDTSTVKGKIGDGNATLISSDYELGYKFETRDSKYNNSQTITRPKDGEAVIYYEDQGGLKWKDGKIRDDGFEDTGFIRIDGSRGNDNQALLAPSDWERGDIPNGNGGQLTLWTVDK